MGAGAGGSDGGRGSGSDGRQGSDGGRGSGSDGRQGSGIHGGQGSGSHGGRGSGAGSGGGAPGAMLRAGTVLPERFGGRAQPVGPAGLRHHLTALVAVVNDETQGKGWS
ncbi:unnamed protein product [Coccothraustes coccothraustes]